MFAETFADAGADVDVADELFVTPVDVDGDAPLASFAVDDDGPACARHRNCFSSESGSSSRGSAPEAAAAVLVEGREDDTDDDEIALSAHPLFAARAFSSASIAHIINPRHVFHVGTVAFGPSFGDILLTRGSSDGRPLPIVAAAAAPMPIADFLVGSSDLATPASTC